MNQAIELESLCKGFVLRDGKIFTAVKDITLSIPKKHIFGFLGHNGAGKTTTIKMICGLIRPTTGTIKLNGYDIIKQRSEAIKQIGAVLEGTRNIYWQLSAWENLMYFGHLKGWWGNKLKERAKWLLNQLELWDRKDEPIAHFSRGNQQKVAIACALITDPPIILLDEPTLGLDIQASRMLKIWIKRLAEEEGKTIILTTHQLDVAEQLCERIAIINQGSIVADQPIQSLLSLFSQEQYEIVVGGKVKDAQEIFPQMNFIEKDDKIIFSGGIKDQEELYQKLNALPAKKLSLVSVTRITHNLEEVFVRLMQQKQQSISS